jgi:outer membrane protein OmpA-like peptidoglycan-associated protein
MHLGARIGASRRRGAGMNSRLLAIVVCCPVAAAGCATKGFVQEQVTAAEVKLDQKAAATAETQDAKLRETAERAGQNRQAIDAAAQRLQGLDTRVGEADAAAADARARAEQATAATQTAEARLTQRLAGRNNYRVLDTRAVHFDSDRIDIRKQDVTTLDEVAGALAADPNAILELQGFADTQGSDRYNRDLSRERVEVVMRYLVQQHSIELRQLHGLPMGKIAFGAGERPTPETMAAARRVELRVLTPWSSWEDRAEREAPAALPAEVQQREAPAALPAEVQQHEAPAALPAEVRQREAPAALPAEVQQREAPATDGPDSAGRQRLPAFLRDLTPRDFGGD